MSSAASSGSSLPSTSTLKVGASRSFCSAGSGILRFPPALLDGRDDQSLPRLQHARVRNLVGVGQHAPLRGVVPEGGGHAAQRVALAYGVGLRRVGAAPRLALLLVLRQLVLLERDADLGAHR